MSILPVVMSGGSGTRLWPASTQAKPKQFHALATAASMLQDTVTRLSGEDFLAPVIIGNVSHELAISDQLDALGTTATGVILEPLARNTAAVSIVAALFAQARTPGAKVLLLPADHAIVDAEGFRAVVRRAAEVADHHIVTFGIEPTGPETGYGYIERGEPLGPGAYRIARFVEKPDRATAERYVARGAYAWNAGIFLYRPDVLLSEAARLCPDILAAAKRALDEGVETAGGALVLGHEAFESCRSAPVDIAIMERTDLGAVAPCDIGWADIGSWSELWRFADKDADGNVLRGETIALASTQSLIWSDGPAISVIGVSDLVVIATGDHVLVLPKDRAQDVKTIAEAWRARGVHD